MTKKTYTTPEVEQIQCSVESGIAASVAKLWYEDGGTGDFTYTVDTDDEWK